MRNRVSKAFTLVEILIVVVILGILAAIVIPQFTNASTEAQTGNVKSQLQTIRSQIELYRVRNNGVRPALAGTGDTPAVPGTSFGEMLTPPNLPNGAAQDPYMRTRAINPRNGASSVTATNSTGQAFIDAAKAAGANGWLYNLTTGEFGAQGFDEVAGTWS